MGTLPLPKNLESKLTAYRKARKAETGKMMFRETAILELLKIALEGYSPPMPLEDRLKAIEKRLTSIELNGMTYGTKAIGKFD
jgi:hypothetical protein